jgi:hypothetical protein
VEERYGCVRICLEASGDGQLAVVQVKTGQDEIWLDRFEGVDQAWVFQPTAGTYRGEPTIPTVCIDPNDLIDFMRKHPAALPPVVRQWTDWAGLTGADR